MTLDRVSAAIVKYRRTSVPYPDEAAMRESFSEVFAALGDLESDDMGLLVDVRSAQGRNDDAFEAAHAPLRERMFKSFSLVAMVVSSVVGKLQVTRYMRVLNVRGDVFFDPVEAEQWLEQALANES
jgi:hypothetical protein